MRNAYKTLAGKLEGNRMGGCGLNASGSRWRPVMGWCEHGNETLGSIKGGTFS
jgi:hypothetical protein